MESRDPDRSYMVTMQFKKSANVELGSIEVRFRPGWDQYEGDYYIDEDGNSAFGLDTRGFLRIALLSGAYTMEIIWGGKLYGYSNVYIGSGYYAYQLD